LTFVYPRQKCNATYFTREHSSHCRKGLGIIRATQDFIKRNMVLSGKTKLKYFLYFYNDTTNFLLYLK